MKDALALALVHFIWQGAVLAVAGALLMRVTKAPSVRYAIGVATMVAMLLAPVITFLAIENGMGPQATPRQGTSAGPNAGAVGTKDHRARLSTIGSVAENTSADRSSTGVVVPATLILSVWAVGVLVLSLRFAGGWALARRLATQTLTPVGDELQSLAAQLATRLNVRGAVRVCESASVAVPMMIGWLRPVIVLPPAALVALPLAQLEALLAHELAHIRRHDYLVNLLQTGVETLCFYHPAVWWISREVRRHREHCCDDVAVGVCDRLTYVTALSSLASISTPQFALSAAGGSLRDRVRRLIEPTTHSASPKGAWIAMLPILLVVSFVAPHAWGTQSSTPVTTTPVVQATTAREVARVEEEARRRQNAERAVEARAVVLRARELEKAVQATESSRSTAAARARELTQEVERQVARRRVERQTQVREALPEVELALLEARLRQQEIALARQRELHDKGLTTQQVLLEAEAQLNHSRLQLERAKMEHEMTGHNLELRKHAVEADRRAATHRNLSTLEATAQLQPQDRLEIAIDGEPDLPTTFTVREDGSIRFPFLGSIRVQGSTTAQVQSAIKKLISDKGLARNPVVTVSAGRVR